MPPQRGSIRAQPEPTIIQGMCHRLDVIEEQWEIHSTPSCINLRYVEQESPFHQDISVLPRSSLRPVYDEPIYDEDIPGMENSLMIKHIDVFSSFGSTIEGALSPPTEDLLEILRSEKSYVKRSGDIFSLEPDQHAPSVEELLLNHSESSHPHNSQEPMESHLNPTNTATAVPEDLVSNLKATSYPAVVSYDMVLGDLLSDPISTPHRLQAQQFWERYMNCEAASRGSHTYHLQEHAPKNIWISEKNFLIWIRVRKNKISVESVSNLGLAVEEIDVAFDEGDVSPTWGE